MSAGTKVVKETIYVALSSYGLFQSSNHTYSRARAWVLSEPDSNFGQLRIAYNDSRGLAVWHDIGQVNSITVSKNRWDFLLPGGVGAILVPAPCVCGAGAVGYVGPSGLPHRVINVRPDLLSWIHIR